MTPSLRDLFGKIFRSSYYGSSAKFLSSLLISSLFFSFSIGISASEINSSTAEPKSIPNLENVKGYAVKKVNHEFVNLEGNTTDIIADSVAKARYQKKLEDSNQITGMRFHIHWAAPSTLKEDLTVKLDIQGYDAGSQQPTIQSFSKIYTKVEGFSGWAVLDITESSFKRMGKMMAWKVTLLHEGHPMATRKSFTWDDR